MKPITAAIIEDEPTGVKTLKGLLKEYLPDVQVKAYARNLIEAQEAFSDPAIDLYFADIELLDGNIFEVLEKEKLASGQHIIFITAYEEFGVKAFEYPALHYLLKPLGPHALQKAVQRYRDTLAAPQSAKGEGPGSLGKFGLNHIQLPTQNGASFIDINAIVRIQSANKYSIVFTNDKKQHIVLKPLTRFEEMLAEKGFIRVHDSHLVNINHMTGYVKGKGGQLVMTDSTHVPVSVRRKEQLSGILKFML